MSASFFDKFLNSITTYSNGIVWPANIDYSDKPKIITYIKTATNEQHNKLYEKHIKNILKLNNEKYGKVVADTYTLYRSPWQMINNFLTNKSEHIQPSSKIDKNNPPIHLQYFTLNRFSKYYKYDNQYKDTSESLVDFDNINQTEPTHKNKICRRFSDDSYTVKYFDTNDSIVSTQRASFDKKINYSNKLPSKNYFAESGSSSNSMMSM